MKGDEDHAMLGAQHAREGLPRYKYQDKRLQEIYDLGYNGYYTPDDPVPYEPEAFNRHRCMRCNRSMTNTFYKLCSRCRSVT